MIKVENIVKRFGSLEVLHGVSMSVARGEIVSIVGASGAGKTTLLQIIGTLMDADSGSVTIDGVSPAGLSDAKLSEFRNRHIGFVFQFHHLLAEFTARENVMMPMLIAGMDRAKASDRAMELLSLVNMSHRTEHKPSALSGGEQQRVPLHEPWLITLRWCWQMSLRATSIALRVRRYSSYSSSCVTN